MTKILFGDTVVAARGTSGGTTFSHNMAGAFMHPRSMPRRAPNTRQSLHQARWNSQAKEWQTTLSAANRIAWQAYADTLQFTDSLAQPYTITGFAAFMRTAILRLRAGLSLLTTPPDQAGHSEGLVILSSAVTISVAANTYSFAEAAFTNWSKAVTDDTIFTKPYVQQSPQTNAPRLNKRLVLNIIGNAGAPPAFPQAVGYPYGQLVLGNLAYIEFSRMEPSGRVSKPILFSRSIAA